MTGYAETALVRGLGFLAEAQQAITHNLANVNSAGFKRRLPSAAPAPSRFLSTLDAVSAAEMPTVRYSETADWSPGNMIPTNEPSHVALETADMFRVRARDGRTFFTRIGQLQIDADGYLTTPAGHRYLDPTDTEIQLRAGETGIGTMAIAPNGAISDAATGEPSGRSLGVFRPADADRLRPVGGGLYLDGSGAAPTVSVGNTVRQGQLEASNVESVTEMINMMVVQRTFQATATALRGLGQLESTFLASMTR